MAVTKVAKSVCRQEDTPWWHLWKWSQPLAEQDCGEYLKILPKESAYPVDYRDWEQFFLPAGDLEVRKSYENSFGVHLWNKMRFWGDGKRIVLCDDAPVFKLLSDNCPRTAAAKLAAAVGRNYGDV